MERVSTIDSLLKQKIDYVASVYQDITQLTCYYQDLGESEGEFAQPEVDCCRVCQLFRSMKQGHSSCKAQVSSAVLSAIADDNWKIVVCRTGLLDWIVPVFYGGNAVGYFISGFVCNSGDCKKELKGQAALFSENYEINLDEFQEACSEVHIVQKDQVRYFARLLYDLCRIHIPAGKEQPVAQKWNSRKTVFFEDEEEELLKELPKDQPLSQRVYSKLFTLRAMEIFWKSIEVKANNVFANIMSKRILEAHIQYDEIMNMAYCEPNLLLMRTSAETLYHIITLTRYTKEDYDIRIYRLTFETMQKLFETDSAEGIKKAMDEAFEGMCYYFVADPHSDNQNPVTNTVVEFLEKNYHRNIKVEDVAKNIHMSPAYISRVFKNETNFTIKWWLNSIRMKHAQELLLETDIPIKEIGPMVGYNEMRGFYKMFAKYFGVTCSEIRKNAPKE